MGETGGAKVWVLAFVLAAGAGFGALVGIGCALGANACPFGGPPGYTGTDGARLFAANCAVCHGIAGGGGAGPTLVAGPVERMSVEELRATIARGRPIAGMPAFRRGLRPDQIEAVARYVLELRGSDG